MAVKTERQVLRFLLERGAARLERVRFRENRSTIWSLTQGGSALNLHTAFRNAPPDILAGFAVIAREAQWRVRPFSSPRPRRRRGVGPCCATPEQRVYLRELYAVLNRTRFDDLLPAGIPVRLSSRMTSRLGQMVPARLDGSRTVVEVALNVDLMLAGNGSDRIDTLLHEMAHAASWLFEEVTGHGADWRHWARRAGCRERACASGAIQRRKDRSVRVTRVPALPGQENLY